MYVRRPRVKWRGASLPDKRLFRNAPRLLQSFFKSQSKSPAAIRSVMV